MNRIRSVIIAFLSVGVLGGCVKKQFPPVPPRVPLTVIVMDTTQALLPNAEVKLCRTTYKTSYDGRVVLQPEQIISSALVVTCQGYRASGSLPISHNPMLVQLLPAKRTSEKTKSAKGEEVFFALGASRRSEHHEMVALTAAAPEAMDALEAEEAPRILPAYDNADISAGRLTAGEVNDFAKWSLWPKVMEGSHQAFVAEWGIAPLHRYTVQVMNKDGYPVANYPVSLTDTKGNTVFQAVTDNTGKAELWNGLIGPQADIIEPQKTIVVDEPCSGNPSSVTGNPSDVDVVFVFDATGSMGDELSYLQAEMNDVISRASAATGGLAIRTGAVVYRDHGDEYITRLSRLTEDIKTTQAFIDKQSANGGGDYPEAVPEALMAALNSAGWDEFARTRIAFLILDAPCHQDSATLALLHEQVLNAAALGVRIVPVVCSGIRESSEYLMRAIALATNGTSFFLTDDSGIGNTHLKPTTDSLKVEHLNDMMVRTIVEFSYMPACEQKEDDEYLSDAEAFLPNPFTAQDLEADPTIPHGEGVHYLLDVSGKLLGIYEGEVPTDYLPKGVYFIKTFYEGRWYTQKILIH